MHGLTLRTLGMHSLTHALWEAISCLQDTWPEQHGMLLKASCQSLTGNSNFAAVSEI